jgi:2,4-diaminopentanoate dehydrogenase
MKKYRVVQWCVGNVGRRAIIAIHNNPQLELVGCYVHGAAKAGVDAGVLAGIAPIGVIASQDVESLLALRPDCVSYNGLWANADDFCRILERGINIVTTSAFITGHALGVATRERIQAACRKGNSSIFGSGIHPGFSSLIGLVAAGICDRIENISVLESVDATGYASKETWESCGFGAPIDTPDLEDRLRQGSAVFSDGIHLAAEVLRLEFDEIGFKAEFSAAVEDCDFGFMQIARGCVAGVNAAWYGCLEGRRVMELKYRWKMGPRVEPDYPLHQGYVVSVRGRPNVEFTLKHSLPDDEPHETAVQGMQANLITTALPAINAIAAVCAAPAGIRSYADLPLLSGAGFVVGQRG